LLPGVKDESVKPKDFVDFILHEEVFGELDTGGIWHFRSKNLLNLKFILSLLVLVCP